jgi:hypothetical protein
LLEHKVVYLNFKFALAEGMLLVRELQWRKCGCLELSGAWAGLKQLTHLQLKIGWDRPEGNKCIADQPALEVLNISLAGIGRRPAEGLQITPLISRRMPLKELRINIDVPVNGEVCPLIMSTSIYS